MKIYAAVRTIDTETTGLDEGAHVVELGWCDIFATAKNKDTGEPERWVVDKTWHSLLVNPGICIPPEAQAAHHISDSDVAGAPDFDEAVKTVLSPHSRHPEVESFAAYAAHHAKYDRQYLDHSIPGPWICSMRCWQHIDKFAPGYGNQVLRYHLKPRDLDAKKAMPPHRAGPDAYVTAHLVRDLLNRGNTVERLVRATERIPLLEICPIGDSWRGRSFCELDSKSLRWLKDRPDSEEIRYTAEHWLRERGEL